MTTLNRETLSNPKLADRRSELKRTDDEVIADLSSAVFAARHKTAAEERKMRRANIGFWVVMSGAAAAMTQMSFF